MATSITVPRLGWSMDEGTFVEWLKRDGDRIRVGDALFVLESEKAAENVEAIVIAAGPEARGVVFGGDAAATGDNAAERRSG